MGTERLFMRVPGVVSAYRLAYRSLRPEGEVVATIYDRKIYLDPEDMGVSARLITLGGREPVETDLFRSLITKGSVVVDIGANVGYYTLLASDLVGDCGTVVAFEPTPANVALLHKSIEANGYKNVTVVAMAVSNRSGTAKLLLGRNSECNRITPADEDGASIRVETVTLDEYFAPFGMRVDLIKIDAEGAEMAILEGARELLARNPDLIILTEYNPKLMRAFGTLPSKYLHELISYGFELVSVDEGNHHREPLSGDAIDRFTEHLLDQPPGSSYVNLLCLRGRSAASWHASGCDARGASAELLLN